MIIRVCGSVDDVDAGVDTLLSSECISDIILPWAKSVKVWVLDDNDDGGDVGASDCAFRLRAVLDPHSRRFVAFLLMTGWRWRRYFLPCIFVAGAGAAVLSSLFSPVLAPLSMKCGVVVVSGPHAMMKCWRMGRGDWCRR